MRRLSERIITLKPEEGSAGVVGTGKIGTIVARIRTAFGCRVLAYDIAPSADCQAVGVESVTLDEMWRQSDVITLQMSAGTERGNRVASQGGAAALGPRMRLIRP